MRSWQRIKVRGIWLSGLASGLLIGVGMMIGAVVVNSQWAPNKEASIQLPADLQAVASSGASTFAIATGQVSESEGIYFLDFLTGNLTCAVLYKNGEWGARFATNVFLDLEVQASKKPHFMMVTGATNFARGPGGGTPGKSVVYVVDSTTGSFVVYWIPWNRQAEANLSRQSGALIMLQKGQARDLQIRDQ